jgi:hypothetical protein
VGEERLRKLARSIDALVDADDLVVRHAEFISSMRAAAAAQLHGVCATFARQMGALLRRAEVTLDPACYDPGLFREGGLNLFQINARGRILQIEFDAPAELISTENFRRPYILEGSVRCFSQHLLERDLIEEQLLFYCLEDSTHGMWRFFDGRTYRTGLFDQAYLVSLMEQLL